MPESSEDSYRIAFERLWDEKSSQVVSNGKDEHAAALFSVFLHRAEKSACFFCKELRKEVYDDECVVRALDCAITKGVRIEVLVQLQAPADSIFAGRLREAMARNCNVSYQENIPDPYRSVRMNFAYIDGHAFRFEKDNNVTEAVAAAWGEQTVKLLNNLFFHIKASLPHVPPPANTGTVAPA